MLAPCVTKWPTNSGKILLHAIVYPTKTKPAGLPKNNRRLVTTQSSLTATATVIKASKRGIGYARIDHRPHIDGLCRDTSARSRRRSDHRRHARHGQPRKGARPGIEARGQFYALMESVLPRDDVTFEADTLGGVPGLWVQPADWRSSETIVHLHGGWFTLAPPKRTAILSGMSQRERERGRLSRTIGLLLNTQS